MGTRCYGRPTHVSFGELGLWFAYGRIDANPANKNKIIPIYWTAKNGAGPIVKAILECCKTELDADCGNGSTSLTQATSGGHTGVAEVLRRTVKVSMRTMRLQDHDKCRELSLAAMVKAWESQYAVTSQEMIQCI